MGMLRFKQAIVKSISPYLSCPESQLLPLLRIPKHQKEGQFSLSIPQLLTATKGDLNIKQPAIWCQDIASKIQANTELANVQAMGPKLCFHLQPGAFTQSVLQQVFEEKEQYGWAHQTSKNKTVLIDYSSPNIAKPFHAGHLRSTILGNFIKRIHTVMGYRVIGINYLGDWGKQYGLLAVGFEKYGVQQLLESDPIHHLYQVYVKINQEAEMNPSIHQQANNYFKEMEQGNKEALSQWQRFRDLSIASYEKIYDRLGIEFEDYSGESQVNDYIPKVYELLRSKNKVIEMDDGGLAVDLSKEGLEPAMIQRADGTSLYLTRDLASILMRQEKYSSDKAIYVVGTEQQQYFKQLFACASLMTGSLGFLHASFGRINGMSTRQGTAVFLQDILDTAQSTILDYMQHKDMDQNNNNEVADQLGISAILIQDMKSKRNKNYTFAWDRMTDARGDTGVFLQYAHARACGIERHTNIQVTDQFDASLLKEQEAFELIQTISYFPEVVQTSFDTLEPCTIVNYLFKLSHATSLASHTLRVKGSEPALAEARMALFWAARITLYNGMTLLGIRPLEKM
ncbi:arginyl-tRNA synthetase [Halteromyces radiatus]|uniref:arginyl-tRNA synthetase n=1 Tax=Halteromyces radiatus TaxID=101107 RepID=UPI00221F4476|nr:arginyl-tRNA synthetase [Halteromyces radiatus]KAI8098639.1 arginyl-tRNA synthetase [Halteromyces radiatus]